MNDLNIKGGIMDVTKKTRMTIMMMTTRMGTLLIASVLLLGASHFHSCSIMPIMPVEALSSRQPSRIITGAFRTVGNINNYSNNNENQHPNLIKRNLLGNKNEITSLVMDHMDEHKSSTSTALCASSQNLDEHDTTVSSNTSSSKSTLFAAFSTYFATTLILAKMEFIGPYTDGLILRDTGAALLSTILALIFVKSITTLASKNILQPRDSRKIIHSLSAPLFMVVWPLFSDLWGARLFAASVPFLQGVRLYLAGMNRGGSEGNELAGAISRSGNEKEVLGGPFIYVIILFAAITTCFTDNYAGMMALSAMAAGDGMADIIGRRLGKNNKWFFNKDKSIAGTVAFIVASSLCSIGLGSYLQYTGAIGVVYPLSELVGKFVLISIISAIIELVPIADDNWSVPIGAGVLTLLLL